MSKNDNLLTGSHSIQEVRKPFPGFPNIDRFHCDNLGPGNVYTFIVHTL